VTRESIDDVIAVMQNLEAKLPVTDGVACFNRMYLEVTNDVRTGLHDALFGAPEFMARLDVVFASFYLDAVDAAAPGGSGRIPTVWRPLFAARRNTRIFSIQFAWAGMTAHIYHDLPLAVVKTCREAGISPDAGTIHSDFQKVDVLLDAAAQSVRQSFESGLVLEVDERAEGALDRISDWSINSARDVAWGNSLLLWAFRDHAHIERAIRRSLARVVATTCRWLLRPV
jgi:Family of unknown function (DUF5995)